jgi:hypothetical protein
MPVIFHLRVSTAAKHAGRTDRRVLGVRRRPTVGRPKVRPAVTYLLPVSPRDCREMPTPPPSPTPRPSVDIDAPPIERPRLAIPSDIDYDEFRGASPGFCIVGKCHCGGRCDPGFRKSTRYTYDDFVRDCTEFQAEEEAPLSQNTKTAIVKVLATLVQQFVSATNEQKIALIVPLTNYILDEPGMRSFLIEYPSFATVLKDRMLDIHRQLPGSSKQSSLCKEVLDRFFYDDYVEEYQDEWGSDDQW